MGIEKPEIFSGLSIYKSRIQFYRIVTFLMLLNAP